MKRGSSEVFDLDSALRGCYQCSRRQSLCPERRELVNIDTCRKCLKNYKRKFEEEKSSLERENDELKANLDFLSYHRDWTRSVKKDISIVVEGQIAAKFGAHRAILASKSPVFCKMLETDMVEKETGVLRIDDATLPVMRAVIGFCYDAKIKFTEEVTSEAVLAVAHKYAIDHLSHICESDLTATIHKGNLAKRLKLAKKFEAKGLEAAAHEFFKGNFDNVVGDVLTEFR